MSLDIKNFKITDRPQNFDALPDSAAPFADLNNVFASLKSIPMDSEAAKRAFAEYPTKLDKYLKELNKTPKNQANIEKAKQECAQALKAISSYVITSDDYNKMISSINTALERLKLYSNQLYAEKSKGAAKDGYYTFVKKNLESFVEYLNAVVKRINDEFDIADTGEIFLLKSINENYFDDELKSILLRAKTGQPVYTIKTNTLGEEPNIPANVKALHPVVVQYTD